MPPKLLIDHQHRDVGLPLLILANNTADDLVVVVGHEGEGGELCEEVVVGEDGVGLGEFGADGVHHPFQLGLVGELAEGEQVGVEILHHFL